MACERSQINESKRQELKAIPYSEMARRLLMGEIAIPKFQRPYVWKQQQIIDFFNAIIHDKIIGGIALIWQPTGEIDKKKLTTNDDLVPGYSILFNEKIDTQLNRKFEERIDPHYIADGQQRLLTYLFVTRKNLFNDASDKFDIAVEIVFNNNRFECRNVHVYNQKNPFLFRIKDISNFTDPDSVEAIKKQYHDNASKVNENFNVENKRYFDELIASLYRTLDRAEMPVINYRSDSLVDVVNNFKGINQSGTCVSERHLMNAVLIPYGINFEEEIMRQVFSNNKDFFGEVQTSDADRNVLKCFGVVCGHLTDVYSPYRKTGAIISDKNVFENLEKYIRQANDVKEDMAYASSHLNVSVQQAIQFLTNYIEPTLTWANVPNNNQFVMLTRFFSIKNTLNSNFIFEDMSDEEINCLIKWFWGSSFINRYGRGMGGETNKDAYWIEDLAACKDVEKELDLLMDISEDNVRAKLSETATVSGEKSSIHLAVGLLLYKKRKRANGITLPINEYRIGGITQEKSGWRAKHPAFLLTLMTQEEYKQNKGILFSDFAKMYSRACYRSQMCLPKEISPLNFLSFAAQRKEILVSELISVSLNPNRGESLCA